MLLTLPRSQALALEEEDLMGPGGELSEGYKVLNVFIWIP